MSILLTHSPRGRPLCTLLPSCWLASCYPGEGGGGRDTDMTGDEDKTARNGITCGGWLLNFHFPPLPLRLGSFVRLWAPFWPSCGIHNCSLVCRLCWAIQPDRSSPLPFSQSPYFPGLFLRFPSLTPHTSHQVAFKGGKLNLSCLAILKHLPLRFSNSQTHAHTISFSGKDTLRWRHWVENI